MTMARRFAPAAGLCALLILYSGQAGNAADQSAGAADARALTCAQMEQFLKTAKLGRQRTIAVGVTAPSRVTLDDGTRQHDAATQTVDVTKNSFQSAQGTELNFRDSWQFNVAGYELAKILELNMVPPYVERKLSGAPGSLSWWISDAMMEKDRVEKKIDPPEPLAWNVQMYAARVFHQLIADSDFNMTNILVTKDWRVWLIDFTRAFRTSKAVQNPARLTKVDRKLLANLRAFTPDQLQKATGRWLAKNQQEAVLARRDQIVKFFDAEIAAKGETAIVYDFPRTSEPCGTGLT
jgi:hypothetical protein